MVMDLDERRTLKNLSENNETGSGVCARSLRPYREQIGGTSW